MRYQSGSGGVGDDDLEESKAGFGSLFDRPSVFQVIPDDKDAFVTLYVRVLATNHGAVSFATRLRVGLCQSARHAAPLSVDPSLYYNIFYNIMIGFDYRSEVDGGDCNVPRTDETSYRRVRPYMSCCQLETIIVRLSLVEAGWINPPYWAF